MQLSSADTILFTGDSITDAGRFALPPPFQLAGYTGIITGALQKTHPGIRAYNRGISGNTTKALAARMESDLKETNPTAVSILIGINDVWRKYDSNTPTSHEDFEQSYRAVLTAAQKYTKKIILLEPFILPATPTKSHFMEDLAPKTQIIRALAREFKTEYLPLDGIFAALSVKNGAEKYSGDGIHLTQEGNGALAEAWVNAVECY